MKYIKNFIFNIFKTFILHVFKNPCLNVFLMKWLIIKLLIILRDMDNRPIKGSKSGKYNMDFVDPTNDICAYYGGMA